MKFYLKKFLLGQLTLIFTLTCVAFSPQAQAVCQEGCDLSTANTFLGDDALISNTTGGFNTAIGLGTLFSNTTGHHNTAIGASALSFNTTGIGNTAVGGEALRANTSGFFNTASGFEALAGNSTGFFNTANGNDALFLNTTGSENTATGSSALDNNSTGSQNTATGRFALGFNTTGSENTSTGFNALVNNTTGNHNIALGFRAGGDLTTGDNNIDIGNPGVAGESNAIRIGKQGIHEATFIAGISGVTVAGGVTVIINGNGRLGTIVSSERFKDAIKPMDKASQAILALKPVTFRYKKELDPDGIPQFGLVAEEVEKVNPDLVARDEQGKPYTVRYEAVNAMLLNEFLKEHRKVTEQEATITQLKAELQATATRQQKQIDALTAGFQKVSAQLEVSRAAPQTVLSNQ
jgi:hypothetical protein